MINIVEQNDDYWLLNKPAGVSLLRDRSGEPNLWQSFAEQIGKPYMVHRLDKGTSGALIIARSQASQSRLTKQITEHNIAKYYLAIVVGQFPLGKTVRIDLPLCKGRKSKYRVAAQRASIQHTPNRISAVQDRDGLSAISLVRGLGHTNRYSLVMVKLLSGRTHQIRVHLTWSGYPVLGDTLYGSPGSEVQTSERLRLHCRKMCGPDLGTCTVRPTRTFLPSLPEFSAWDR